MLHLVVFTPPEQVPLLSDRGDQRDRRHTTELVGDQEHAGVPRMNRKREHAMSDRGDFSILAIQRSEIFQQLDRPAQRIRVRRLDPAEAFKIRDAGRLQVEQDFGKIEALDFRAGPADAGPIDLALTKAGHNVQEPSARPDLLAGRRMPG